jgi:signal transduction histidine kinase
MRTRTGRFDPELLDVDDAARRNVLRDLHDGAQQSLLHTILTLKLAKRALRNGTCDAEPLVGEALACAQRANAELRELAHGILPPNLTRGGLRAAVAALATGHALAVEVRIGAQRFPTEIEAGAYFIVAEALTNVLKHADAEHASVTTCVADATLRVEVRDDGIGGADTGGHGLAGLRCRVDALGGRLEIDSPAQGGTVVVATLPLSGGR